MDESAAAKVLEFASTARRSKRCAVTCGCRRDPKQLPLCQKCKEIYEVYQAFNEGLNDRPDDA